VSTDAIDRSVFLARSGKPHNPAIAHLTETHSLPGSAGHLFERLAAGAKDPDTVAILKAIRTHRDANPQSPTFGCYKWFMEDPAINDTNASFFICTPLTGLFLAHGSQLNADEMAELKGVFQDVLPWFRGMAEHPSLFYPNKCISDAAMLLATGHVLDDEPARGAGRAFCHRYLDYYARRGTGWGEDHSPVYVTVILEMTLLIMAFEKTGPLYDKALRLTDAIMDWVAFHDGLDAVPAIRTYNFKGEPVVDYPVAALIEGRAVAKPRRLLLTFADMCGYRFRAPVLTTPRQRRWRTFDSHFSVSYVGANSRLGTLSHYPLMPNGYMHDGWGLGWQSKPASFILNRDEFGTLEWESEDDEGVVRQHPAAGNIYDWASRHLFKRVSFHPEVVFVGHQEGRAAIVLREIHHLHSPTRRLADRWRVNPGQAQVHIGGKEWDGQPLMAPEDWIVMTSGPTCVAIRALQCRGVDAPDTDRNPQRRTTGNVRPASLRLERTERGVYLSVPLIEGGAGMVTQHLLFSGWCVVLLDRPEDVGKLSVRENFTEDGEVPRTYGELIRTVELQAPDVSLRLVRDILTGTVARFVNGKPTE